MIKRKLALFLVLIMLLSVVPTNVFAANKAKLEQVSDKAYEEVIIDGMPYKVYKVSDLMDGPIEDSTMSLMSMPAKPLGNTGNTGESSYKFVLRFAWQTYDRPINPVTIPVYFGKPSDPRAIRLGSFTISSPARGTKIEYFNMKQEYFGTHPSIDFLVENSFSNIELAVPRDMVYDFILASSQWYERTKTLQNEALFTIEGNQSVMHGYGIRWYDTDPSNRTKIPARWTGKVNSFSDVKLGIKDRNYSVYNKSIINPKENIHNYGPDEGGGQYTIYDYYYDGIKVITYADKDNEGKIKWTKLAINTPKDAPDAGLTVDGSRHGEKVLKNNTKYFYDSVGGYRTFHVLSMREALEVYLNSGLGKVGNDANKDLKVNSKEFQEIGHSESIQGNESNRTIKFTGYENFTAPPNSQFIGWSTKEQKLTGGVLSNVNASDLIADASGNLTAAGKNYIFKEKKTTFYAVYNNKPFDPAHVENMVVKTQPKLNYTEGEKLDLTELVVTLTDNQGVTKDVEFKDFAANGITATPANGAALTLADNAKTVKLTKGSLTAETKALTVKAKATPTDPIVGPVDPSVNPNPDKSKNWTVTFVVDPAKGTIDAKNTFYVLKDSGKTLADLAAKAPKVKANAGFKFTGWSLALDSNLIINQDITVKAQFDEIKKQQIGASVRKVTDNDKTIVVTVTVPNAKVEVFEVDFDYDSQEDVLIPIGETISRTRLTIVSLKNTLPKGTDLIIKVTHPDYQSYENKVTVE